MGNDVAPDITVSLAKIAHELKRLNDKLDKWTYHDAVSIIDVGKV